ncbi:MAG: hypothetical protein K1X66_05875 [Verrucomicrobiae bacterium]|nr:hypothetical protein [Verrucomicrobiae bacterium]
MKTKSNPTYRRKKTEQKGFALISVLLLLVVLTVSVTAFLTNMRIERIAARNIVNVTQAQMAAEAGLAEAMIKLTDGLTNYHYVTVDEVDTSNTNYHKPYLLKFRYGTTNVVGSNYMYTALGNATNIIQVADGVVRDVGYTSLYAGGNTNMEFRYGYWIDEANSKQNALVAQGKPREYLTNLNEFSLLRKNGSLFSQAELLAISSASNFLLTPSSINQVAPAQEKANEYDYTLKSYASYLTPEGGKQINIKKLAQYIDSLSMSQALGNPRAALIDQLLDGVQSEEWGSGDFSYLKKKYGMVKGRQILANIIDYLDSDVIPTTDNDQNPSYLGIEAKLVNGGLQGHPFINFVGTGMILNMGSGNNAGKINSTRVVSTLGLVYPWTANSLEWNVNYSVEISIKVTGSASGGSYGDDASNYFLKDLNEKLTDMPPGFPKFFVPFSGWSFPQPTSGSANYANFKSFFQQGNSQAVNFNDLKFEIEKVRLLYTSTSGISGYVQILDSLSEQPIPAEPPEFISQGQSPGSRIFKYTEKPNKLEYHLNNDPRLNYLSQNWIQSKTAEVGTTTPDPLTPIDFSVAMEAGDGIQGVSPNHRWYANENAANHFYVASTNFQSLADMGYIFSGDPWKTLKVFGGEQTPDSNSDAPILNYFHTGLIDEINVNSQPMIDGFINVNTAKNLTFEQLFYGASNIGNQYTYFADLLTKTTSKPFINIGNILTVPGMKNSEKYDFRKEDFMRFIANALTLRSQNFTIYSAGEIKRKNTDRALSKALLKADIEIRFNQQNQPEIHITRKTFL